MQTMALLTKFMCQEFSWSSEHAECQGCMTVRDDHQ